MPTKDRINKAHLLRNNKLRQENEKLKAQLAFMEGTIAQTLDTTATYQFHCPECKVTYPETVHLKDFRKQLKTRNVGIEEIMKLSLEGMWEDALSKKMLLQFLHDKLGPLVITSTCPKCSDKSETAYYIADFIKPEEPDIAPAQPPKKAAKKKTTKKRKRK